VIRTKPKDHARPDAPSPPLPERPWKGRVASTEPLPGLCWDELVAHWIEEQGSLAELALALTLAEVSVERALRRLRGRGQRDGGAWGRRLLRAFGVPRDIERRVRWMGVHHSRFTDLPVSNCLDQLRIWDRPPLSASKAHVWIRLGFAACALRVGDDEHARAQLRQARLVPSPRVSARIEIGLLDAYLSSKEGNRAQAAKLLMEVEPLRKSADAGCPPLTWSISSHLSCPSTRGPRAPSEACSR
jgi:hypothetical protein